MSIKDNLLKIKPFIKPLSYGALLLAVALSSYGLGSLSAVSNAKAQVVLGTWQETPVSEVKNSKISEIPASTVYDRHVARRVVASKSGKAYHLLDCPGARQIAEVNKVFFESEADAQKAGYTPAKTCKGLAGTQ